MISRLKSLELHGYKTFASRMLFEFPVEITAIVGPNGAGKSNVADALRWVLGEQSYSLLRGRKTEDMIFAGSEHRTRASMASATITFNNDDGWLPIDFSEVTITRRAYRDGQNEYLMNGQRVRLKEIHELLAQSGLAERTYTIIGQGLVDAALSLKPEERRKFFEEAAGIGLYRSRREESLNRLDTTRRNLERVFDILTELEPRLRSLERQARRAQEFERVKADLQVLLRDWYGHHWHRLQQELVHAQEVYQAQETRLDHAREKVSEVEAEVDQSRHELQKLREDLNQWHNQSSDLHRQRERISRSLAVLDERQRALQEQQQNLETDQARVEEERRGQEERLELAVQECARLQSDVEEARAEAEQARKNLQARQQEREQIERTLRDTRRELINAETRQVKTRAHHGELVGRVETLARSRRSALEAVEGEAQALQAAEERVKTASQQSEAAASAARQAEEAMQTLRRQINETDAARRKAVDERSRLQSERSRHQAQLDVLEQAERSFSGLNQGARFVLEAAQKGRLPGSYRSLSSQIEVPAEYETALAAVLGEYLDGILLDRQTDIEQPLSMLEQGGKGRTILFPLEQMQPGGRVQLARDEEVLGLAAELIQVPEELKAFIDALLGSVIIVRTRAAARRLAKDLPATARAVTLKGEVFWGSGVVVAGQDGRSGMIARPRQKRELQQTLERVQAELKQVDGHISAYDRQLSEGRSQLTEREKEARQGTQVMNQAVQLHQKAALELEQVRQRTEWQRKQLAGLETQIVQTEKEAQELNASESEMDNQIRQLNDQVRAYNRQLGQLPLDELQAQLNHWRTAAAVSERAAKDAETRLGEYRQALEANARRQSDIARRLVDTASALQQIEDERNAQREQEVELNQAIEALQRDIDPAEAQLQAAEKSYSKLQDNQSAAQQAQTVSERYAAQAQIELARQREAMESLRRRIEDDFGLVALTYETEVVGPTPLPLGDLVAELPIVETVAADLEDNINRQRAQLRRMGAINPEAQSEFHSVKERYDFMKNQVEDLKQADADLRKVIGELDELMKTEFRRTFDAVAAEFKLMFTRLFGGGSARLVLMDEENPIETGVDIEARLPGRREQGLALLSGGERSLTAVALIFSLLKVSPTPFCVMDEVDAALDESNVGRFCELLAELSEQTQFILITHNRNTVQTSGVIYGVTMGRDSASQIISLKLDEVSEEMAQ